MQKKVYHFQAVHEQFRKTFFSRVKHIAISFTHISNISQISKNSLLLYMYTIREQVGKMYMRPHEKDGLSIPGRLGETYSKPLYFLWEKTLILDDCLRTLILYRPQDLFA